MTTQKGFTLVEVLIAISIITLILISILSFRVYYNNYLQSLVIKNNLKASIAKTYYNSVLSGSSFQEISNYLKNLSGNDSFSFNIDKIKITFSTVKIQKIPYKDGYEATITTQTCYASYKYKNKEINFKLDLPFIVFYRTNYNSPLPPPPPPGNQPVDPVDPIDPNPQFIFAAKSF